MDSTTVLQQTSVNTFEILKVVFAAIISITSIYIATLVYFLRRREPWGRALFEIVKLMEKEEFRNIRRKVVYVCARASEGVWTVPGRPSAEVHAEIDRWGAYMDMVSLLIFSHQLNRVLFFEMYGDVVLRSAHTLAPYGNEQRLKRGEQFWLPYQDLTREMLRIWKKRIKVGKYPPSIRFAERPDELTVESMSKETELRRFLTANGRNLM